MSTANPYAAPQSDINVGPAAGASGSLEDAMAGRYDYEIGEVFKEAWRLTDGIKLTFWATYLLYLVGVLILSAVLGFVVTAAKLGMAGTVAIQVVTNAIGVVISMGIWMLAVRRAGGLPVSIGTAFSYFDLWLVAIGAAVLYLLLVAVGLVLLVIPGLYLGLAYYMSFPLIGDRRMGAWQALETSRKAVGKHWFKVFFTFLAAGLLMLLSALLIIPLFWTGPWCLMVYGVVYRRIFGVASTA